jgi:predicted transcriptional regulator
MPCLTSDGRLTESAKEMLQLLDAPRTPDQVAQLLGLPLYRIRASLREMVEAGLVEQRQDHYATLDAGRKKLLEQS